MREKNLVVMLPFYETHESVRKELTKRGVSDPQKYENEGQLIIEDASTVHFDSQEHPLAFFQRITNQAEEFGFREIFLLVSTAPFTYFRKVDELVNFESKVLQSDISSIVKRVCYYNKKDYNYFFTREQLIELRDAHNKQFIITEEKMSDSGQASNGAARSTTFADAA